MFDVAKNKEGRDLFILVDNRTDSIKPGTYVSTWENCIERFNMLTEENDDANYFAQLIHKVISESGAEASMRCNKRGYGCDYFRYITIEPLYVR